MYFAKNDQGLHVQVFDGVCHSHEPGHAPHAIQVRKAIVELGTTALVHEIKKPASLHVDSGGQTLQAFNHQPGAIFSLRQIHKTGTFTWVERFGILVFNLSDAEGFAFNLSREPISPCQE